MNKTVTTVITALGVILLGGFLLVMFGNARFNEGYARRGIDDAKAANKLATVYERIEDVTKDIVDGDLDARLGSLGIMRENR
jgi:hypothetical protein